ncbi:hypothetical protein FEM48_Zijuj04G0021300 [Ziziphus jujuba var. spinosa]|uniref:Altered inheritance of mitochondria protein 32 n=1 Tax=Ziziphus jujuba var. spinosa TaxID=714518 RepID=A0A978VH82_ZIZJJ|nr:altered inheritance of mitochondria protein 32-like [Ziziphus jujuba var. spinosa]KAH7532451.1 hypothetical protein FEM48_Zijuj04G0021300 [Ziziphus jujuba var. spinosa]
MRFTSQYYRSLISATHHCFFPLTHISNFSKPLLLVPFSPRLTARFLHRQQTQSFSMASDNLAALSADDEQYGFRRPEMYQSNLAGTVDPYDRHVFLRYKSPESWASRVEASDSDPLPKLLASALKARKNDTTVKTKLTVCEGSDETDGDVLIFPEMIKCRGLKDSDVDGFVEDVLVNGKPWTSGVQEVLSGSYIFVCAHGSRDRRCGVCGPVLIEKLNEEIGFRGLNDQIFVSACSHVGGHKYAGNLIIFSPGPDGSITGHWYGYVTPEDVPELLDQHIGKGEIIERLWRGQLGKSSEESDKANDQKLPNGEEIKSKENHKDGGIQNNKENFAGCCQGANGFTCCRDGSSEESSKSEEKKLKDNVEASGKEGPLCKLSAWVGTWEQTDVLAAAALVGAVATVAVAYSYYRRSG